MTLNATKESPSCFLQGLRTFLWTDASGPQESGLCVRVAWVPIHTALQLCALCVLLRVPACRQRPRACVCLSGCGPVHACPKHYEQKAVIMLYGSGCGSHSAPPAIKRPPSTHPRVQPSCPCMLYEGPVTPLVHHMPFTVLWCVVLMSG